MNFDANFAVTLLVLGLICALAVGVWLIVGMRRDIERQAVFRRVAEHAKDGLALLELDSQIVWANEAYCVNMGYSLEELIGQYPLEFALPPEETPSKEVARRFRYDRSQHGQLVTMRNQHRSGRIFMHQFSQSFIDMQGKTYVLLVGRDITEQVDRENALLEAHAKLKKVASVDPLTGLYNRMHMEKRLLDLVETGDPFAVFQMDLNGFKQINDTYGHPAGDAILCHVADVLRKISGESWVFGRMGGDEFLLLVPVETSQSAARIALEIAQAIPEPIAWESGQLSVSSSVGVYLSADPHELCDTRLSKADVALYEAKTRSNHVAIYDDQLHRQHTDEQKLNHDVAQAVKEGQIDFHLQPVIDAGKGQLRMFEMLARWCHPKKGVISPDVFIPVIGSLGLMPLFDRQVVKRAVQILRRFDEVGLGGVGLTINLSPEAFSRGDLAEFLMWECDEWDVDFRRLTLEVLETTVFARSDADTATKKEQISRLTAAGFPVLMDDFGVGHAGLAHLAELSLAGIKIDCSLSSAVDTDASSASIMYSLVALAEELGLEVIAEGVENEKQIDLLTTAGYALFQGYAIERPMPIDEAIDWASMCGLSLETVIIAPSSSGAA